MLLNSVTSPESVSFQYTSRRRITPSVLPDDDYHKTHRTLIANLESSYLLFSEASSFFSTEIESMHDLVTRWSFRVASTTRQRNFFSDLLYYRQLVNVMIYHGSELTFVRNVDPLLAYCGYENKQDIDACLRIFPGRSGYIQMKPHDTSCYSYLCITTVLIDDSRSYESVFEWFLHSSFHVQISRENGRIFSIRIHSEWTEEWEPLHTAQSSYCQLYLPLRSLPSALPDALWGMSAFAKPRDDALCGGCGKWKCTTDSGYGVQHQDWIENRSWCAGRRESIVCPSGEQVEFRRHVNCRNECANSLLKVLETFNTSFLEGLLKQFYANLHTNKHHLPITYVTDTAFKDSLMLRLATCACQQFLFLYRKLFLSYFVFVLSLQFEWEMFSTFHLVLWCIATSN